MTKAEVLVKLIELGAAVLMATAWYHWDRRRHEREMAKFDTDYENASVLARARLEALPHEELKEMHRAGKITEVYKDAYREVSNNDTQ